jgi:hypothetical protein
VALSSNVRHDFEAFKDIFTEVEAFDYKNEAFIKITTLLEDIFREMEHLIRKVLSKITRLLRLF